MAFIIRANYPRFDGRVLANMLMFCNRLTPCHASMPAQERNRHLPKFNNPAIFTCYVRGGLIKIEFLIRILKHNFFHLIYFLFYTLFNWN